MAGKAADSRLESLAAVQSPGEHAVFAPRHVTQLAAAPRDADGLGVVRIVRLANELERIADPQLVPQFRGSVMAKPCEGRALHEYPDARPGFLRPGRRGQQQSREQDYSPNASRIHSTRDMSAPTRNTSKRQGASGRRVRYSLAAARRRERFATVTLSAAPPKLEPLRMRTSAKTRVPRSSAIRSISPCRQRQLRSMTRRPQRRRSSAHRSSARAPAWFMAVLTKLALPG